jgi:HEAT repeat protein
MIGAVEHYITYIDGSELARSVLILLRPKIAMDYCMKVYREDGNSDRRHSAIELLRSIGDRRAFEWVPELLSDPDPTIQTWGAGMVDQLLFAEFIGLDECTPILEIMSANPNPGVRRYHELILQYLRSTENSEQPVAPNGK